MTFCRIDDIDPANPTTRDILQFLHTLKDQGLSCQTIKGYRSAINHLLPNNLVKDDPLISRFMKGLFRSNPPLIPYSRVWDVASVLHHIRDLGSNEEMAFLTLSKKIATLLMILSQKRRESIDSFDVRYMDISRNYVTFIPSHLLKHDRQGYRTHMVRFRAYPECVLLCPVQTIKDYMKRREEFSNTGTKFFVTSRPPHNPAHKDTIGRWVKDMLKDAGIDTDLFKVHSVRAAASSKALVCGAPLSDVLKAGDWSGARTFFSFYRKDIVSDVEDLPPDLLRRIGGL